jgi:hypothetical protein
MNAYHDKATLTLDHLCTATRVTQRGPVVEMTFPDTAHAYAAYVVVAGALEHECQEVRES